MYHSTKLKKTESKYLKCNQITKPTETTKKQKIFASQQKVKLLVRLRSMQCKEYELDFSKDSLKIQTLQQTLATLQVITNPIFKLIETNNRPL